MRNRLHGWFGSIGQLPASCWLFGHFHPRSISPFCTNTCKRPRPENTAWPKDRPNYALFSAHVRAAPHRIYRFLRRGFIFCGLAGPSNKIVGYFPIKPKTTPHPPPPPSQSQPRFWPFRRRVMRTRSCVMMGPLWPHFFRLVGEIINAEKLNNGWSIFRHRFGARETLAARDLKFALTKNFKGAIIYSWP